MITSRARRRLLTAMLGVGLVAGGPAFAAKPKVTPKPKPVPKPVCDLVTDPKGDAEGGALGSNEDQALDIISADIATNNKYITAAIRVAKLTPADVTRPQGAFYQFQFIGTSNEDGHPMYVQAEPTGATWQGGSGTGVFDFAHSEIRITLPLSYFGTGAAAVVPGPPLHGFTVYADLGDPVKPLSPTLNLYGDTATSNASYVPGTPSCVPVGH
jgi:hypothetical protein